MKTNENSNYAETLRKGKNSFISSYYELDRKTPSKAFENNASDLEVVQQSDLY